METTNNYGYAPGQGPAPSTEKETKLNLGLIIKQRKY